MEGGERALETDEHRVGELVLDEPREVESEELAEEVEEVPYLLASPDQLLVFFLLESSTLVALGLGVVQDGLDEVRGVGVLQHGKQVLFELAEEEVHLLAAHGEELLLVVATAFFGLQVLVLLVSGEVLLVVQVRLLFLDVVHFRFFFGFFRISFFVFINEFFVFNFFRI